MSINTRSCKKHDSRDLHRLGHSLVMVPPDMTVSVLLVIRIKGNNFSFYCHGEQRLRRVQCIQVRLAETRNSIIEHAIAPLKIRSMYKRYTSQCLFEI
jgi:hypothetical protein